MHIGQRIKNVMKRRKVSTRVMADYCEVTPGAVSNWFSTGRITKENLVKVADRLAVSVEDLISGAVGERDDLPLAPADSAKPRPDSKLMLSIDELELVLNMRELLPEDREAFFGEVKERSARMRQHARLVLERAGVASPASDERVAEWIKAAPTIDMPERRLEQVPVEIDRRIAENQFMVFVRKNTLPKAPKAPAHETAQVVPSPLRPSEQPVPAAKKGK